MVRRFLYLNGLAILCVVMFHTAGMGFVAMFAWGHRYLPAGVSPFDQVGSAAYYALRFIEAIVPFSIPAFLTVSGFFVAAATGRTQKTVGWHVVLSRIKTLVIPYLIWSFVVLVLRFIEGRTYSPLTYLRLLLTGQTNEVLYFVPLLIQFYLVAPLLVRAVRWNAKVILALAGAIQLLQIFSAYPMFMGVQDPILLSLTNYFPKWFFLTRIFWFTFGIVLNMHAAAIKDFLHKYRWWLLGITIAAAPLGFVEWEVYYRLSGQEWLATRETFIDAVYAMGVVLSIFAFDLIQLPWMRSISDWGGRSFGIYLIHPLVIELAARLVYRFLPGVLGVQLLYQPYLIALGLGVPLFMMWFVNRTPLRRFYSYLFG